MGRLMEDLLAMFGIKPSDRVKVDILQPQQKSPSTKETTNRSCVGMDNLTNDKVPKEQDETWWSSNLESIRKYLFNNDKTLQNSVSSSTSHTGQSTCISDNPKQTPTNYYKPQNAELSLKEINQEKMSSNEVLGTVGIDHDCMGCRIIGSAVCFGASIYVWQQIRRGETKFESWRKRVFRAQGILLILVLVNLGVTRAFNIGLFSSKPVVQQLGEEVISLYNWIDRKPPQTVRDFVERKRKEAEN